MRFRIDFASLFGKAIDQLFAVALTHPDTFHGVARPILQGHAGGDLAKAQELALEGLHAHLHVLKQHSDGFLVGYSDEVSYGPLRVPVAGRWTTPVGTAAGIDPQADGLEALSYLFGLQMPGPVSLHPHEPSEAPFQEDVRRADLYVPPTFASRGVTYVGDRLREYREAGGEAIILPAVVGGPETSQDSRAAHQELEDIVRELAPLADGFVWIPGLADSSALLQPADFRQAAQRMRAAAEGRLNLVEMPACEEAEIAPWLALAEAFLAGGGDGIVAVSGQTVPRDSVPRPDQWPFQTAVRCGASMAAYRQRAIEAARRTFPGVFIAACGGFHRREEAFQACEYANVIVENEAYTRFGPGIARVLLNKLALRLKVIEREGQLDQATLYAYQQERWSHSGPEGSTESVLAAAE